MMGRSAIWILTVLWLLGLLLLERAVLFIGLPGVLFKWAAGFWAVLLITAFLDAYSRADR